jgi:hypothetical protein
MSVSTIVGTGTFAAGAISADWDVGSDVKLAVVAPAADEAEPARKNAAKADNSTKNDAIEVLASSEPLKPRTDGAVRAARESTRRL